MPEKTMDAFRDHGTVRDTLTADVDGGRADARRARSRRHLARRRHRRARGRRRQAVLRLYSTSSMARLPEKRRRILGNALNDQAVALPSRCKNDGRRGGGDWRAKGNIRRLWNEDASLWTGSDEGDWLGWLDVIDAQLRDLPSLNEFAAEVRAQGFSDVLLLGMGGSSLGPEVLAETLGLGAGLSHAACSRFHRSATSQEFRAQNRSEADAVHRVEQIGHDARAERVDGIFLRKSVRRDRRR